MSFVRKTVLMVLAVVLLVGVAVGGVVYYGATRWHSRMDVRVEVDRGMSLRGIADRLSAHGVIRTPTLFELLGRTKGMSRKLKAGFYEFPAGTTMMTAMARLERGEVIEYPFTIIEGWTISDIAQHLGGQPFLASSDVPDEVARLARDPGFVEELGLSPAKTLEGYLFPETYQFANAVTAASFLHRLVDQFREVWKSIDDDATERLGLTEQQIVTLASIVEKETGAKVERARIAGVFFNRLNKKMPLQSDPTIIYGLPNFDGNLRKRDLANPHRYNTYVHGGLPPGPICNPGRAALEAVLHPEATRALYFVSRNDGTHVFSETLTDHNRAVQRFQVELKGRPENAKKR